MITFFLRGAVPKIRRLYQSQWQGIHRLLDLRCNFKRTVVFICLAATHKTHEVSLVFELCPEGGELKTRVLLFHTVLCEHKKNQLELVSWARASADGGGVKVTVRKSVIFSHRLKVILLVKSTLLTSVETMFYNSLLTNIAFLKACYFNASYIFLLCLLHYKERKKPTTLGGLANHLQQGARSPASIDKFRHWFALCDSRAQVQSLLRLPMRMWLMFLSQLFILQRTW